MMHTNETEEQLRNSSLISLKDLLARVKVKMNLIDGHLVQNDEPIGNNHTRVAQKKKRKGKNKKKVKRSVDDQGTDDETSDEVPTDQATKVSIRKI